MWTPRRLGFLLLLAALIAPMPATNGENVRTIGTNRAMMIVFTPYFS